MKLSSLAGYHYSTVANQAIELLIGDTYEYVERSGFCMLFNKKTFERVYNPTFVVFRPISQQLHMPIRLPMRTEFDNVTTITNLTIVDKDQREKYKEWITVDKRANSRCSDLFQYRINWSYDGMKASLSDIIQTGSYNLVDNEGNKLTSFQLTQYYIQPNLHGHKEMFTGKIEL